MPSSARAQPHFWILDTRHIWSGQKISDAVCFFQPFPTNAKSLETDEPQAPEALALISAAEAEKVRKFVFLRDAKLSLGAALLKRLYVAREGSVAWHDVQFTRQGDPVHGKPAQLVTDGSASLLDFNVSHQAGLVALAGCATADGTVGVDIVCVDERDDRRFIAREGFDEWIDMHESVFSPRDVLEMKTVPDSEGGERDSLDARIRFFYAFWSLKEAYVKLVGEGLLADWLREVDFRGVRLPVPAVELGTGDAGDGVTNDTGGRGQLLAPGGKVEDIEVWVSGRKVENVKICLQAFGNNYMIATAIKNTPGGTELRPEFKMITTEEDIYPFAT